MPRIERTRPADVDYFIDYQTEHVRQGDIFAAVPFVMSLPEPPPNDQPSGEGSRRVLEPPFFFEGFGMLISHSSGLMNQPPLTRGYAHPFRTLAPVLPIAMLEEADLVSEDTLNRLLRKEDALLHYMYLPPWPDVFPESVVVLYRPTSVHQELLEGQRKCQLRDAALRQLQVKLVLASTGRWTNPEDYSPSMRDHWNEG